MKAKYSGNQPGLDKAEELLREVTRFSSKLSKLIQELRDADDWVYQSRNRAAAKRASLDLSQQLSAFRNGGNV